MSVCQRAGTSTAKTFPCPARQLPGASLHPCGCKQVSRCVGCRANATWQIHGLAAPPMWLQCFKHKTTLGTAQRSSVEGAGTAHRVVGCYGLI